MTGNYEAVARSFCGKTIVQNLWDDENIAY